MSRLPALIKLHEADPEDADLLYMIGHELVNDGQWEEAITWLARYTERGQDVGAGFGLMADCCEELGRDDDAKSALRRGIDAARVAGHPSMANEYSNRLQDMG